MRYKTILTIVLTLIIGSVLLVSLVLTLEDAPQKYEDKSNVETMQNTTQDINHEVSSNSEKAQETILPQNDSDILSTQNIQIENTEIHIKEEIEKDIEQDAKQDGVNYADADSKQDEASYVEMDSKQDEENYNEIDSKQDVEDDTTNSGSLVTENQNNLEMYTLNIVEDSGLFGTVTISPQKTLYSKGETVTITPVSANGYVFKEWGGTDSVSIVENKIVMDSNKTIEVVFEQVKGDVIVVSTVEELMATEISTKSGNKTVLIADGDYVIPHGLYLTGANLTYKSQSGDRDAVVIRGDFKISHIFQIINDDVTIQDISIGEVNNHGIQLHSENDADNGIIRNIRFFNIKEQMIKGSSSSSDVYSNNCLVENCLFEFTKGQAYQYYTGGIDVHKGDGWVVRGNIFKNIISPTSNLTEGAIHFWSNSRNTLIEDNIVINCDRGIMLGLDNSNHFGGIIRNNTIHVVKDTGIYLANADGAKVYNNTIFLDNAYPNAIEYRFTDSKNISIINNLTNKAITSRNGGTARVENNIVNAQNSWFVNALAGDLHLKEPIESVVNKAVDLPEMTFDIDGDIRALGLSDIGADDWTDESEH